MTKIVSQDQPGVAEFLFPFEKARARDAVVAALWYGEKYESRPDLVVQELRDLLRRGRSRHLKANLSDALAKAAPLVETTASRPLRWRVTASGRRYIDTILEVRGDDPAHQTSAVLRRMIAACGDADTRDYLEEAVRCYDVGALRAAVVFVWVGSIDLLGKQLLTYGPAAVDAAIRRHDPKARRIRSFDDLAYVKESQQLLAAEELNVIDKSQRSMLEQALELRNKCGHPGRYRPGVKKVEAMLEDIAKIVFAVS